MKDTDDLTGKFARLPDGQKVIVGSLEGGSATVVRVGGERPGTLAVCRISKLEPYRKSGETSVPPLSDWH